MEEREVPLEEAVPKAAKLGCLHASCTCSSGGDRGYCSSHCESHADAHRERTLRLRPPGMCVRGHSRGTG